MADFDTEFASFRGQKPQADGATFDDEFSAFRQTKTREQAALRSSVDAAMQTTPEQAAKVKYLSTVTGIDPSVIATQEGEVKARAKFQEIQKEARFSPVLQARLRDPEFTKLAIDDVPALSKIEKGIGGVMQFVMGADGKGGLPGMVERGAKKAYYGSVSGTSGVFRAASEFAAPVLDPLENVQSIGGNPLRRLAEGFGLIAQGANANSDAVKSPYDGNIAAGAESGFTSVGQNAKYAPFILAGPAGVAAALVGMSLETGGQSYQQAREKGINQNTALMYGASDAVVEFATEKIPMHRLIGDVAANTGVFKTVAKQIGLEVPGEQIATALQDLNEWAVMHPEKTFGDYIAARPDAAIQTLVATIVGTGGNVAVTKALGTLMDAQVQRDYNDLFNAQRDAQERAAKLQDVMATAAGSKLRELSPETFREHVQAAADGQEGAPKSVHIDGQVLLQTLQAAGITEEQLAQSMPSVVAQLAEAATANSTVEIPIGELATALPGTPLEQALLPHLRIGGPESLSQSEAEQAQQQAQEYLKGEADRVMQESQDQVQWTQESEGIKSTIRDQLAATGRFSDDVNGKYATLVRDFYSVMASRTGMTPKAMYDLMPYKVGVRGQSGAVLDTMRQGDTFDLSLPADGNSLRDYKVGDTTITLDANANTGEIKIASVRTPQAKRGNGAARAAMSSLIEQADRQGVTLKLDSSPLDKKTNGSKLMAFYKSLGFEPTGKKINAAGDVEMVRSPLYNQEGKLATESDAFKNWFGDSKVVDAEGKPLVVYHGTPNVGFTEFDTSNVGTFFSSRFDIAASYAGRYNEVEFDDEGAYADDMQGVYEAHISLKNPLVVDWGGKDWGEGPEGLKLDDWANRAKREGHDGLIVENVVDVGFLSPGIVEDSGEGTVYVAFNPTQIKSVFNRGTFDPNDANILNQSAIGDKLMARVENEFPALVQEYKALPETNGGQVINTDMARELSPEYRADRTRSAEVHDAASALMSKLYAERLAQPVQEGRAPAVLFTAGGTGAGKSSGLEMMPELAAQSDIIYDGTMSKLKGAEEKIEQALASGRDVQYMYVYREPGEALKNGALPRAMSSGRTAPLQVLQDSHTGARTVAEALAEKYKDNPRVSFIFIDNSQGRGNAKVVALANIPQVSDNGLKEKLNAILDQEYQAGNISDAVYAGTKEPVSTVARSAGNDAGRVQPEAGSAVRGQFEQGGSGELKPAFDQTQTEAFKRWFGKSKVVDADGKPLVVHHGTQADFQEFDYGKIGQQGRAEGAGFYFTTNKAVASGYGSTLDVYLAIEKPLAYDAKPFGKAVMQKIVKRIAELEAAGEESDIADGFLSNFGDVGYQGLANVIKEATALLSTDETAVDQLSGIVGSGVSAKYVNRAVREVTGYDGVVANGFSNSGDAANTIYVAFFPEQIKSATGNSGAFNPEDANILKQEAQPNKYQAKYLAGRDLASLNAEERAQYDILATQVTDTPEFKNWFGDSKVVDADGKPLVVYHGTPTAFTEFKKKHIGARDPGFFGSGFYFTPNEGEAQDYAESAAEADGVDSTGSTTPAYLSLQNPFIWDMSVEGAPATRSALAAFGIKRSSVRGNSAALGNNDERKAFAKGMRSAGHDGVIVRDEDGVREVVAFEPTQIKSATGNNGQFDPNNPSILAQPQAQGPRGTFNPSTLTTVLNENADLSTFLHETGHFFLEAMATLASQPNADPGVVKDMNALLKWFGVSDLATWQGYTLEQQRQHHERFAESFELYLLEGKAPNTELAQLFRTFRAWLTRVYKSLSQFMEGRDLQFSDDIRQVMDRMLATEAQIAEAEKVAGLVPNLDATGEAIEQLQSRSIRDLKWAVNARNKFIKQMQQDAKGIRKAVEAEVTDEVEKQPIYAAMKTLREGNPISIASLEDMYTGDGDRYALLDWKPLVDKRMAKKEGSPADYLADSLGFKSGDEMVRAILNAEPIASVIEGMTDQRMLERYGDLVDQDSIELAATEAVHNAARAKSLATELAAQRELLNPRQDTGKTNTAGNKITVNALAEAAKQFAANVVGRKPVGELKKAAYNHLQAERRAAKAWEAATAKGDTKAAVQAKQDQMLNNAAVRAAHEAIADAKKTMEFFAKVLKGNSETVVEKGRDPDIVNAARAILAVYGVGAFKGKNAFEYMDLLKANDPSLFAILDDSVRAAVASAKPVGKLTVDELTALKDEIASMWHLAKSSRQYEVDGDRMNIEDAAEELKARMEAKGVPAVMPGDFGAVTEAEKRGRSLQFAGALLRRVEQWAEGMDGKFGGPFLKLVFQPVKAAADRYRADRAAYRKQFTALVENVSPSLKPGLIEAPELGGYTFGKGKGGVGQAELLSAMLHLGNESNKRKLLLGRNWATENEDGTLDTSRWDAFMERMHNTGVVNKAHYDFAQGVWDLLESMKPLAQKTHRDVYGRYFAEVTANTLDTPFGPYKGGYVPAQVDPEIVKDNELRKLAEVENENMAYAFPATNKGFTKGRTEYNRPLMLDLRTLPQHIDKVLLFSHMEPAVRGVSKVLSQRGVSSMLGKIDPAAIGGMLTPWLNRSARQIVETPIVGDGRISRVLSVIRARAGMSVMFANLSNTVQQLAGLTLARVKIERGYLLPAMAQYARNPKKMSEAVAAASSFMATRMDDQIAALNGTVDEILLNPSVYESAKNWTAKHTYFLQSALDNVVGPVVWSAAYNQALADGMSEKDAVHFADGTVRQTQGSTLPEDVSRIETGPSYARIFTQFIGYFNMVANTNVTALKNIADDAGLKRGAGKALAVLFFGLLAPAWIAEAIAQGFKGGPDDEDKDGYLDDWLLAVFGLGTVKTVLAGVPFVGQFAMAGLNTWNGKPYDDRTNLSPAVSMLEGAVGAPRSVYKALVEDGSKQKAVRDLATAVSLATGLPVSAAARPIGYLTGVAENKINPTGPADAVRGVVTGTASPESKR